MTQAYPRVRVDGIPKGQPRPQAFARKMGGKVVARVFTPGTAEAWKGAVAVAMEPHRPSSPVEGAVCVEVMFFLPRPKGRSRKSDPTGPLWCPTRPDLDNLAKAVLDCLTLQGWWRDDSQVVDLRVTKYWHAIGERPGAVIGVMPLDEELVSA